MNKPRGPIAVLLVATTLGVSGCALEIWEGSVFTASGDTLFRDTFFTEKACLAETAEHFNALSIDGRKKMSYSGGDWVEQDPDGYRCRLKHRFGL